MSDPVTPNVGLFVPSHASDVGSWDEPCNANFSVTDSLAANVAAISLTNAPVTLSTPPNSGASWSGPYQSQSGILVFTGTLTAACTVTLPRPGFWIVYNLCVVGSFYAALASSSPGNIICAPPGEAVHIYCDGTNVNYVNLGRIGSYLDLAVSAVPAWISNCTVPPYLNCDGSSFSGTTYPTLASASYLGGTTLPDLRGRARFALNQGTGRLEISGGTGIDGDVLLSAGGSQTMAQANLPSVNFTVTIPAGQGNHTHGITVTQGGVNAATVAQGTSNGSNTPQTVAQTLPAMSGTAASGGSGASFVPPGVASGLILIRAG